MTRLGDRISDRIAEEAQLLSEEKWIIETLTKIKKQKNSLQIEKLHLENLEAKLKAKVDNKISVNQNRAQHNAILTENPDTSFFTVGETRNHIEFEQPLTVEVPAQNMDLDTCIDEELDLAVSKSVFSREFRKNVLEEYEEEEDDDDDMVIDMNMFMNANSSCEKRNN